MKTTQSLIEDYLTKQEASMHLFNYNPEQNQ